MEAIERELTTRAPSAAAARKTTRGRMLVLASAAAPSLLVAVSLLVPWLGPFRGDGLVKTTLWSLSLLFAFAGWGTLVARLTLASAPLALRAVWGASVLALLGGALAWVSLLSRGFMVGWVVSGAGLLVHDWIRGRAELARGAVVRLRATRRALGPFTVAIVLVAVLAVRLLGAASDLSSISYDDDNAYFPFAKMLLERGTLVDPFSFRRMSALGGQSLYQAVLLTRIDVPHLHVFDRGICLVLVAGLVASFRSAGRVAPFFARVLALVLLLALPNTSSNAASYYSGAALFLGLAQTVDLLGDRVETRVVPALRRIAPIALVAAAACTLRQNYQLAVGLFLALAFLSVTWRRFRRERWSTLVEPALCLGLTALFLAPWMLLLHRSNGTLLFPLAKGTLNTNVPLASELMTKPKLVRFVLGIWLTPSPIHTQALFFLAALFARGRSARAGQVMKSLTIAAALSIVALAVAFSLSDSENIARYYFGFVLPAVLVSWLTVASARLSGQGPSRVLPFGLMLAAIALPIAGAGPVQTVRLYDKALRDLDEQLRRSVPMQAEPPVAGVYRRLQAAVPAGEPILYMLDQPYHLDFKRNPLLNLDTPGLASPKPGMPSFAGPEPVAAYLLAQGIRHVAFVQSERSVHLYRKDEWVENLYGPSELWRSHAPYVLDALENLEALAKTRKHLHEEDGLVLIDLATTSGP